MPAPFPQEFRDDDVRVVRPRQDGVTIEQIAADSGIDPMTATKWIRKAAVEAGITPEIAVAESRENRDLRCRARLLGPENEVLRQAAAYPSQADVPGDQ